MRIRYPFAFAFVVLLLFASSIGLLPHSVLPSAPEAAKPYIPQQSDKAVHFLVFFALTVTFYFILDTGRKRVLHITLCVCTLLLAVGSEVAQGLLPNDREFDPWDVLANVVGSLCAVGLAGAYHKRATERRRRAKYNVLTGEGAEDDLELGETPGLVREDGNLGQQENGVIALGQSRPRTIEEEIDNWDEHDDDDTWDDDEDITTGITKMTPASSSNGEDVPKKISVD